MDRAILEALPADRGEAMTAEDLSAATGLSGRGFRRRLVTMVRNGAIGCEPAMGGARYWRIAPLPRQGARIPRAAYGTFPDRVLAEQYGMSRMGIYYRRRQLGIPGYDQHNPARR